MRFDGPSELPVLQLGMRAFALSKTNGSSHCGRLRMKAARLQVATISSL